MFVSAWQMSIKCWISFLALGLSKTDTWCARTGPANESKGWGGEQLEDIS